MINQNLLSRWINALQNGAYRQVRGMLRANASDAEKHCCCLGVLCDLVDPTRWVAHDNGLDDRRFAWSNSTGDDMSLGMPPTEVREALGLSDRQIRVFAEMNDETNATFEQIAKALELFKDRDAF